MPKVKYTVMHQGKAIGYVYKDGPGDWNSVCYSSEMGHGGMDTQIDAEKDVLDLYQENLRHNRFMLITEIENLLPVIERSYANHIWHDPNCPAWNRDPENNKPYPHLVKMWRGRGEDHTYSCNCGFDEDYDIVLAIRQSSKNGDKLQ